MRRPPPIYLDSDRAPRATSWWDTPAGSKVGHAMFRLGILVWKVAIVGACFGLTVGSLVLLWALIRAAIR
jgi:hypothetical protein